jgi:hypothetical protein
MSRILSREKEQNEKPKNENYPSNSTTDDNNSNTINELDIADGLKHILISHGITVEALLSISPTMIATKFGIDQYVANIIQKAAKYYYITK